MILEGININSESSYATNQAALSLEQLFKINIILRQETPLVYLGLMIHAKVKGCNPKIKGVIL